jgi:hypothetical protein
MDFSEIEEGDRILFNDRKTPLKVKKSSEHELLVEGPKGGEYRIYMDDGTMLVARPGNERYSSYCENLREVGEWNRVEELKWVHSRTEASITIDEDEAGHFRVELEGLDQEFDNPAYGFSSMEAAVEEVEKFIEDNPEG